MTLFNKVKISIIAVLIAVLFGCLQQMPYGDYQVAKIIISMGFVCIGILQMMNRSYLLLPLYSVGLVLYNPIQNLAFKREDWQMVNIWTTGVLFAILCFDAYELIKAREDTKQMPLLKAEREWAQRKSDEGQQRSLQDQPTSEEEWNMEKVLGQLESMKIKESKDSDDNYQIGKT